MVLLLVTLRRICFISAVDQATWGHRNGGRSCDALARTDSLKVLGQIKR